MAFTDDVPDFWRWTKENAGLLSGPVSSALATAAVKRPNINYDQAAGYYGQIAGLGGAAAGAAEGDAAVRREHLPTALGMLGSRAGYAGSDAALNDAEGRGVRNAQAAIAARRQGAIRGMAGMNPGSGAYQARLGAIDAAAPLAVVDAANKGRKEERDLGLKAADAYTARAAAIQPRFYIPAAIYAKAGSGVLGINDQLRRNYIADLGAATRSFKSPFDAASNAKRAEDQQRQMDEWMKALQGFVNPRIPGYDWSGWGGYDYALDDPRWQALDNFDPAGTFGVDPAGSFGTTGASYWDDYMTI